MFRNAFRLIIFFAVAFFIRRVMTLIMAEFSNMAGAGKVAHPLQAPPRQQTTGELKKDPVCGTFVAVASSIKRDVNGQVVHFCSTACRDKYQAA
jgi:YHS domain-containing protein